MHVLISVVCEFNSVVTSSSIWLHKNW